MSMSEEGKALRDRIAGMFDDAVYSGVWARVAETGEDPDEIAKGIRAIESDEDLESLLDELITSNARWVAGQS